jgi:basic amino acid/polyamine antiporter, APA family
VLPILSVLASLWLMLNLQSATWVRFGIWMVIGLVVYFGYSVRHSRLAREGGGSNGGSGSRGRGGAGGSGADGNGGSSADAGRGRGQIGVTPG